MRTKIAALPFDKLIKLTTLSMEAFRLSAVVPGADPKYYLSIAATCNAEIANRLLLNGAPSIELTGSNPGKKQGPMPSAPH